MGKCEGKRPLGRRRVRWKDIKIDLKETGSEVVDWIHQAQDRDKWRAVVSAVMNRTTVFSSSVAAALPCLVGSL